MEHHKFLGEHPKISTGKENDNFHWCHLFIAGSFSVSLVIEREGPYFWGNMPWHFLVGIRLHRMPS